MTCQYHDVKVYYIFVPPPPKFFWVKTKQYKQQLHKEIVSV